MEPYKSDLAKKNLPEDETATDNTPQSFNHFDGQSVLAEPDNEPNQPSETTAGLSAAKSADDTSDFISPVAPRTAPEASSLDNMPPSQQDQYVVGGNSGQTSYAVTGGSASPSPRSHNSHKKLYLGCGLVILVLLLAAGWVFGMYLPNKPENVWKTGVNRTGQALDSVVADATDSQKLASLKTANLTGDVSVKSADYTASGKLTTQGNDTATTSDLNVSFKPSGQPGYNFSAKLLTSLAANAQYPDLYFQISGFKDLGLDALVPNVSSYDGKWITVSGDYLSKTIGQSGSDSPKKAQQLTNQDVADAARAVTATTKDYVFTTDPAKAVLVNKGFVGKETVEGVSSYHYTAAINKDHAKDYCSAIANTIAGTNAFKKFVDSADRSDRQKSLKSSCINGVDNIKSSDTFDVWVGGKYKLIHKVRLHDSADKNAYLDFGQTYKGDDTLNFFATVHQPSDKIDLNFTSTTNTKTNTTNGHLHVTSTAKDSGFTADANYQLKSDNSKVNVTKPKGAVPLPDVLRQLGIPAGESALPAANSQVF